MTLALHLAVASQAAGRDTAIIDLDPQASAAKWSDRRANEVPVVISAHAARLPNEIERVRQAGCDFLLIDTGLGHRLPHFAILDVGQAINPPETPHS